MFTLIVSHVHLHPLIVIDVYNWFHLLNIVERICVSVKWCILLLLNKKTPHTTIFNGNTQAEGNDW